MCDFETGLMDYFNSNPEAKTEHHRLWMLIKGQDTAKRRRRLAAMEERAREKLGLGPIDWSKIDWLTILKWIGAIIGILILI